MDETITRQGRLYSDMMAAGPFSNIVTVPSSRTQFKFTCLLLLFVTTCRWRLRCPQCSRTAKTNGFCLFYYAGCDNDRTNKSSLLIKLNSLHKWRGAIFDEWTINATGLEIQAKPADVGTLRPGVHMQSVKVLNAARWTWSNEFLIYLFIFFELM